MFGTTQLDIRYVATASATEIFRAELPRLARSVVRRLVQRGRGLDIAYLQFRTRGRILAVSSRVAGNGAIRLEFDIGDPSLPAVLITEDEFRRAEARAYGRSPAPARR